MAGEPLSVETLAPGPTPPQSAPTPPMSEQAVRAAVMQAESNGSEVVEQPTQTSPQDVPAKFLKTDGTVDVEKILDSTRQLDAGIEKKQLTIDEALAQYKERERQFRNLPSNPEQVQRVVQTQSPPMQQQPVQQMPAQMPAADVQAQIMAEYQRDPIGTMVDLVKAVTQNQQKPVLDFIEQLREQERDNGIKGNLSELASGDPRVLHPQIYAEITKELERDPGYWQLRNPHKAAWNEVKGRLRLGDIQAPAQPSRTATPILGGGTPPPVPSSTGQASPQGILAAMGQIKTPEERQSVEAEIRRLMVNAGM